MGENGNGGDGAGGSTPLTREGILALVAPQRRRIEVPEWGGHVYVNSLRGTEYVEYVDALDALLAGDRPEVLKNIEAASLLLAFSLTDAEGRRLFGAEDVARLVEAPLDQSRVLVRLYREVQGLNPTGAQTGDLAKNSGPGPG
ncbi:MAG: hypothetical protein HY323_07290 [Betaproteobacteria bacterium]|nr:hypothetical protein [Betaproteobacteria bacterium]